MSETGQGAAQGYLVLARKYRPRGFDQLIGQDAMVRTLTNAFKTGRIAQAYMLTGVRGVGKTTTARIIARALNYSLPGRVDAPSIDMPELGEHCQAIMDSRHVDVLEMDAASHTGIADIREIIESARYKPVSARTKVYIIDEVHMLSTAAFNGLLKTLEEPPEHVKFIFATTEIRKVPITVLSRCQRFDLRRVEADALVAHLGEIAAREEIEAETEALALIARAAEGSVRDALSIMDQGIAHGAGRVDADTVRAMLGLADRSRVITLFRAVMAGEVAKALGELRAQYEAGADPVVILSDLAQFVHLVTRLKYVPDAASDLSLVEAERVEGRAFAEALDVRALSRAWQMLLKGIAETQGATRPLAAAEMLLVRLAHAADLPTPDETIRRLRGQDAGSAVTSPAAPRGTPQGSSSSPVPAGDGGAALPSRDQAPSGAAPSDQPPHLDEAPAYDEIPAYDDAPPYPSYDDAPAPWDAGAPDGEARGADLAAGPRPAGPLRGLEDIVALAAGARDLQLKHALEHNVRLARFEPGRIEMAIEPGTDANFAHRLSLQLKEWTGERWMIIVQASGGPTLAERRQGEQERLMREVEADPQVRRVLERFPGARIVEIRENRLAGDAGTDMAEAAEMDDPDFQDTDMKA